MRVPIKEALLKEGNLMDLKMFKDYVLMKGELYGFCQDVWGMKRPKEN